MPFIFNWLISLWRLISPPLSCSRSLPLLPEYIYPNNLDFQLDSECCVYPNRDWIILPQLFHLITATLFAYRALQNHRLNSSKLLPFRMVTIGFTGYLKYSSLRGYIKISDCQKDMNQKIEDMEEYNNNRFLISHI